MSFLYMQKLSKWGRLVINVSVRLLVCVWIHWSCCVSRLRFSFFFFFFLVTLKRYCSSLLWTLAVTFDREQCIYALFMDPQITLFSNFFIKNGSHGTIYTFKNYFATVFSVFNFQFQQNKFYSNSPFNDRKYCVLFC